MANDNENDTNTGTPATEGTESISANGKPRYWLCACGGKKDDRWEEFYKAGIMAVGWDRLGDLRGYKDCNDLQKKWGHSEGSESINMAWRFCHEVKPGDIVFAKKGKGTTAEIFARGVVIGDYKFDEGREKYKHTRKVEWELFPDGKAVRPSSFNVVQKTLYIIEGENVRELEALFAGVPKKYWWLNADDGIKDFSEIPVGGTEPIKLTNDNGNDRREPDNFSSARVGDVVVVYQSQKTIAVCEISAGVHKNDSGNEQIQVRKVDNLVSPIDCAVDIATLNEIPDLGTEEPFQKAPSEQDKFAVRRGTLFKLTKHGYHSIMALILRKKFLAEVFMGEDQYEKLVRLLKNKKNIILQGPPGVGKTFAARRLAYAMMGKKDDSRIKLVQFHQNYSYEDFVEGYKPRNKKDPEEAKEEGEFVLRPGVFRKFCDEATSKPYEDFFFIIDEINRGNMSKIFGELLMLIEKDYRGDKYSLELAYSREKFSVPENLYIIGMMNTADRSLAMLDYALRRRFAFFEMRPAFDSDRFVEYQKELLEKCQDENESKIFGKLIDWVKALNEEIKKDDSLGEGFCIGHSYFCGWEECTEAKMRDVLECDIIPTLKEYWFDNQTELTKWIKDEEGVPDDLEEFLSIKK